MWTDLIWLILGFTLGVLWHKTDVLQKRLVELLARAQPKATPGVTMGVYNPANEYKQTPGIVSPKSPQLIEWEQMERTKQENLIQRSVKPQ